jgi:hypothetical protein
MRGERGARCVGALRLMMQHDEMENIPHLLPLRADADSAEALGLPIPVWFEMQISSKTTERSRLSKGS